ncbi:hypothetical protein NW754_001345 [Fusarium falciforme]|nr:hypothetical protein NW754_001345 [Fusarium falciforme]
MRVHESVKDAFIETLASRVATLRLGQGIKEGTTQGPLVNAAAVQKIGALVEDALGKGAVLHVGGKSHRNSKIEASSMSLR